MMEKKQKKKVGAPEGNNNAEKWDIDGSIKLFEDAVKLARDGKKDDEGHLFTYDFIGEVARDLYVYREIFSQLVKKYPNELKSTHNELLTVLEANCFSHSKKGGIVPSIAIVNLKSNHGWTDRIDTTTKGNEMGAKADLSHLSIDELRELMREDD